MACGPLWVRMVMVTACTHEAAALTCDSPELAGADYCNESLPTGARVEALLGQLAAISNITGFRDSCLGPLHSRRDGNALPIERSLPLAQDGWDRQSDIDSE